MIPKIIHFIFGMVEDFGGKPFGLPHYLAVKSAYEINKPDKMFVYNYFEPKDNEYWEKSKKYFEIVNIEPPRQIYGNKIFHYAHASDVIRLQMLNFVGGIYLDIDTLCVSSMDDLLHHKFVMAKQDTRGLCNAVMLAEKNSEFGRSWLEMYSSFGDPNGPCAWDQHCVQLPKSLAQVRPDLITVLEEQSFFTPIWSNLPDLFERNVSLDGKYTFHLWEHCSWDEYVSKIDEQWIRNTDCSYSTVAKRFLE